MFEKRRFLRHPTEIPIEYTPVGGGSKRRKRVTKDLSHGGLCFVSDRKARPGEMIDILIAIRPGPFEVKGRVAWCHPVKKHFEIGVGFLSEADEFATRMVEQVCRIEGYRAQQRARGRLLTRQEAAMEWIERFASTFPQTHH
jgi:Tfp pilus assembly protein PilZ